MTDREKTLVVAGASGVIGQGIATLARQQGYRVTCVSQGEFAAAGAHPGLVSWNPRALARDLDAAAHGASPPPGIWALARVLEGANGVVNLAGASLAQGRLNDAHKERVRQSRLDATRVLAEAWRHCSNPPGVWLQASATGYYGNTGEREVVESDPPGEDFLATVCRDWEAAAAGCEPGPRLVVLRFGLVLDSEAPAWRKMARALRWGFGGRLGSGRQWYPWVAGQDAARAMLFLLEQEVCRGAYNVTAPTPVRQIELARDAAACYGQLAVIPAPAFVLRAMLGGVADHLVLGSCRALPARLVEAGFTFDYPRLPLFLPTLTGT